MVEKEQGCCWGCEVGLSQRNKKGYSTITRLASIELSAGPVDRIELTLIF